MASPSTLCASCLRAAQRASIRRTLTAPRHLRSPPSRAYIIAPATAHQPFYLDFLAPCTLEKSSRSSSTSRTISSSLSRLYPSLQRTFTTSSTWFAEPQTNLARAVQNPRTDESGNPMLISLTPRASHRLSTISRTDSNPNLALRITVESGGCHGFQYLMSLTDLSSHPPTEEDTVFEGDKGAKVVIDESSLELLKGSTVDYTMELIGSQFKVTGIPGATSSCGCGTSFDIRI